MNIKKALSLLVTACMLTAAGCSPAEAPSTTNQASASVTEPSATQPTEGIQIDPVENLPEDFILGMDASSVIANENSGVKYYNFQGQEQDVFQTLAEAGVTHIRVRIWNDPFDENGNGYGGGNCNIDTAIAIGQRATKYGMQLIANFHYSDFWADPGKQKSPKAWESMDIEEKTQALYDYTAASLNKLKAAGVDVGMVQIGNETNGHMAGESDWGNLQQLFSAGSKAVREVFPEAKVALHFTNPEKAGLLTYYAQQLQQVDYDVFATSYYPYWHGSLNNLTQVLSQVNKSYGKQVMVMETSYAYTLTNSDHHGNTISSAGNAVEGYPFTPQGQASCLRDVIDTVANTSGGIGVCYWEGTWIAVGGSSWEANSYKWEAFGSGWASSFAAAYDPEDAGKYFGGCAVENQALFDAQGRPLASLQVFHLVRYGSQPEA